MLSCSSGRHCQVLRDLLRLGCGTDWPNTCMGQVEPMDLRLRVGTCEKQNNNRLSLKQLTSSLRRTESLYDTTDITLLGQQLLTAYTQKSVSCVWLAHGHGPLRIERTFLDALKGSEASPVYLYPAETPHSNYHFIK